MGIWDDDGVDLAAPLEEPEDGDLPCRTTAPLALADAAEITLVNLDLAGHQVRRLRRQIVGDQLAQLMVKQDRRVAVDDAYLGRQTDRGRRNAMSNQLRLNIGRKSAPPSLLSHPTQIRKIPYPMSGPIF